MRALPGAQIAHSKKRKQNPRDESSDSSMTQLATADTGACPAQIREYSALKSCAILL